MWYSARLLRGRRKGRGNATVIADDEFAVLVEVVRQLGDTERQETKLAVVSAGDRDIRLGSPYRLHQTCALDARCIAAKCCRRCCLNDSRAHTGFFPVLVRLNRECCDTGDMRGRQRSP